MKTLFIEARYKQPIKLDRSIISKLPDKLGIITTVQYASQLDSIKKQLKEKIIFTSKSQCYESQILGCDSDAAIKIKDKVDAFLYIGDGHFHPLIAAVETDKDVFQYFPQSKKLKKIEKKEVENYKKKRKGALVKFLSSKVIGVLVSTKKGQCWDTKDLKNLEKKYPDKRFYTFIFETLDFDQLMNFPFIEAWINTACPRIEEDIKVVNIKEIL